MKKSDNVSISTENDFKSSTSSSSSVVGDTLVSLTDYTTFDFRLPRCVFSRCRCYTCRSPSQSWMLFISTTFWRRQRRHADNDVTSRTTSTSSYGSALDHKLVDLGKVGAVRAYLPCYRNWSGARSVLSWRERSSLLNLWQIRSATALLLFVAKRTRARFRLFSSRKLRAVCWSRSRCLSSHDKKQHVRRTSVQTDSRVSITVLKVCRACVITACVWGSVDSHCFAACCPGARSVRRTPLSCRPHVVRCRVSCYFFYSYRLNYCAE